MTDIWDVTESSYIKILAKQKSCWRFNFAPKSQES